MARSTDVDRQTQLFRDLSEAAGLVPAQSGSADTLRFSPDSTPNIFDNGEITYIGGSDAAEVLPGTNGNNFMEAFGGNDILMGNGGRDFLNGGAGDDIMLGGSESDNYYVDSFFDVVLDSEVDFEGEDTVFTITTYTLDERSMVESLSALNVDSTNVMHLTGASRAEFLTGNAAYNILVGLGGDDALYGKGGTDTLEGGGGRDYLDGGTGRDTMAGGANNDTYRVDDAGDGIVEEFGGGTDEVMASVSYTLSSSARVEKLTAVGDVIFLGGNAFSNTFEGSSWANTFKGYGGQDNFTLNVKDSAVDSINDFSILDGDKIQLRSTGLGFGKPLSDEQFFFGKQAHDATDRLIYNYSNGHVYFDKDGIGGAAQKLIGVLQSTPTNIHASDFFILS